MKLANSIAIDAQTCLKVLVPSDGQTIFNILTKQRAYFSEWLPFVQFTHKVEDSKGFVAMAIEQRKTKGEYVFKICHEDRMVGLLGMKDTDYINKNTELGYWIAQDFQGRGIMTKAVSTLVNQLFASHKIERVQICCAVGNEKSIAIPKRLGFTLEGIKRNGEWAGNLEFRDLLVFSKLKTDK